VAAVNKQRAEQLMKAADEAQKARDEVAKATDPYARAAKLADEAQQKEIEVSQKKYTGGQNAGLAARKGMHQIDVIRRDMSDPNFMSGAGHEIINRTKEWIVTLGGDPNTATPNQVFRKNLMDMLNTQITAMTQAGVNRIQIAEIKNLKDQLAKEDITHASNRVVLEEVYRTYKANRDIAQIQRDYLRAGHTHLDAGYDQLVDDYFERHPLFYDAEKRNPKLIAPPYLPADIDASPAKKKQWAANMGIKKGDPFLADGPDPRRPAGPDNVRHIKAW
jgi:hypothetical protein